MDDADVENDFTTFPSQVPPPPPTAAEKRAAEKRNAPTKAQLDAAADLANAAKHENELAQKTDLVRRARQYIKNFPNKVQTKLPRNFGVQLSLDEIKDTVHNIELDLNSTNGTEYACMAYEQGIGVLQDVTKIYNPLKLALSGPVADVRGAVAANREMWMPIMQEIAIKYERFFAMGPERRLLFFTVSLLMQVHRANTMPQSVQEKVNAPAPADLAADLRGL